MNVLSTHLQVLNELQTSQDHRVSSHATVELARIKQLLAKEEDTQAYSSEHPEIVAGFLAQLHRLETQQQFVHYEPISSY